jgi:hypothetical protein
VAVRRVVCSSGRVTATDWAAGTASRAEAQEKSLLCGQVLESPPPVESWPPAYEAGAIGQASQRGAEGPEGLSGRTLVG